MAEESLFEKALEAIRPRPKKRAAGRPDHAAQLAAVQKKLAQLSRDVEKLSRLVAKGGGAAAGKTTSRTAKPARAATKKTAARKKVRVRKPLKKS